MGRKKDRSNFTKAKIGLLLIALIPILIFIYYSYISLDVKVIVMKIKVQDILGINVNATALDFGKSYPGSLVYRKINLTNNYGFPIRISIFNSGDISDFVYVSRNDFVMHKNEFTQVTYYVDLPKDIEYKNYTGTSKIIFKRKL